MFQFQVSPDSSDNEEISLSPKTRQEVDFRLKVTGGETVSNQIKETSIRQKAKTNLALLMKRQIKPQKTNLISPNQILPTVQTPS